MDAPIPPAAPALTVRSLKVRAADAPFSPPLQSAAGTLRSAPLVLIDLFTEQGVTGRSWFFADTSAALAPAAAMAASLGLLAAGQPLALAMLSRTLGARFRLLGTQGLVGMALAALDMAAWDAQARALGLPLARLLGAGRRAYPSLRQPARLDGRRPGRRGGPGYGGRVSCRQAQVRSSHPGRGARGVPSRARGGRRGRGHLRRSESGLHGAGGDPPGTPLRRLGRGLAGGAGASRRPRGPRCHRPRLPIQRGENDWGPHGIARSLAADASAFIMPDAGKVGGVTGWMAAAALAEAAGLPVSSHLFVEFSAHLLAATPGRHWLEWLGVARPVLAAGSPELMDGNVVVPNAPGAGLEWDEATVAQYVAQ